MEWLTNMNRAIDYIEKNLKEIPDFRTEKLKNGEYKKLLKSAGYPSTVNAVCGYRDCEGTHFPYTL